MNFASSWWLNLGAGAALAIPMIYGMAAIVAGRCQPAGLFRRASYVASAALALGMGVLFCSLAAWLHAPTPLEASLTTVGESRWPVRLDTVTVSMLLLITVLTWVVVRFSRRYLDGEPGQPRYVRWLMATVGAATLLVTSRHLLVIAAAWIATSLSLHQLLTFYTDRPRARLAAHKKFIVSRLGDIALLAATGLIVGVTGSLDLAVIEHWIQAQPLLEPRLELAAVLLVCAAALKSAQLPFHGWLIQVMEAPTPVSALLHAGVVNLGGLLILRVAPLITRAPLAQTVLVVVGATTAVLAALVMTTRISVKVALAWSTCAQMGFMLVQCGLGAYDLALLHLVAHSLYKAHAFLRSGSAVDNARARAFAPVAAYQPPRLTSWLLATVAAFAVVGSVAFAFGCDLHQEPALWVFGAVVAFAIAPLWLQALKGPARDRLVIGFASLAVPVFYLGWHLAFGKLVSPAPAAASGFRLWLALGAFSGLFVLQALLSSRPDGSLARAVYPHLFAGFYLDELLSRWALRLWPPRRPLADRLRPELPTETLEGQRVAADG